MTLVAHSSLSAGPTPVASSSPVELSRPAWTPPSRRTRDVLGIGWFHGALHVAVFHRQKMVGSWSCPDPVRTLADFEGAFDQALQMSRFAGTEIFLVLENDPFVHQMEQAPAISESAARNYLKSRVQRYEKEHERVLWVGQKTAPVKRDSAYLLHLLPASFYDALNRMVRARQLVLARILPLVVPIQRELDHFPITKGRPVLVAVETGGATTLMVAQAGGQLLFTRTILAAWSADPARIGVEINRSVLYANQQFGMTVERIWLLGQDNDSTALVEARCGSGKQITVLPTNPVEWLQAAAKTPARHPVNLVAGYVQRKRRNFYLRTALLGVVWTFLGLLALDSWRDAQAWEGEQRHFADLREREAMLTAERDRLIVRNEAMARQRDFIRAAEGSRLPAVPEKFLAVVAGVLPSSMRLADFSVRWEEGAKIWSFRLEGEVTGDDETSREIVTAFQRQLTKSPLRVRFFEAARAIMAVPVVPGVPASDTQRFTLEGTLFEN